MTRPTFMPRRSADATSRRPERASTATPASSAAMPKSAIYLTGETRGYKGGKWDRTKVLKPFDKGGWGAIQLNARARLSRPQRPASATRRRLRHRLSRRRLLRQRRQAARLSGQRHLEPDGLSSLHGPGRHGPTSPAARARRRSNRPAPIRSTSANISSEPGRRSGPRSNSNHAGNDQGLSAPAGRPFHLPAPIKDIKYHLPSPRKCSSFGQSYGEGVMRFVSGLMLMLWRPRGGTCPADRRWLCLCRAQSPGRCRGDDLQ